MAQAAYIGLALVVGLGAALQVSLIANLARQRGATEAAWISVLATAAGLAILFAVRALRDDPPDLLPPLNNTVIFAALALALGAVMLRSVSGSNVFLATAGLMGFAYLIAAGFLVPKIGIALFASAVTAGTLAGSVGLDHIGAFGADVHRINLLRIVGLVTLFAGVAIVRGAR
jgi:uncharacterized membrane protein YdcZ (DUF606 family)